MGPDAERLLGESPLILKVLEEVSLVAPLDKPVLIVGERGTGKELIAARLHYLSERWQSVFLKMNCAAISDALLESELFGHEAGAFTGATKLHPGRFERASGGTLFLDELATTSTLVQEKILRVIEYGEFERLGGHRTMTADVRLVAATNQDLPELAASGRFRSDLLDRLAFDVITLPPLRERGDDILLLAEQFAVNMSSTLGRDYFAGFSVAARNTLEGYAWPGNIRELKNVVERAVYKTDPEHVVDRIVLDPFQSPFRPVNRPPARAIAVTTETLDPEVRESTMLQQSAALPPTEPSYPSLQPPLRFPIDLKQLVQDLEIDTIKAALEKARHNQRKAADLLSLTYHQLRGYLKKYQLTSDVDND